MRRLLIAFIGAVALAAAVVVPATAKAHTPLVFVRDSVDHQQPVEQQSPNFFDNSCYPPYAPPCDPSTWVTNPTDCDWDLDDHESWVGTGDMAARTTVVARSCQVSDGLTSFGHWEAATASVRASTPDLIVTVSNDFGQSWTVSPVGSGNSYSYTFCNTQTRPGPYPTIAGSNGGYGFIVTYTLSLTAGSKTVRNVSAVYQHGRGIYNIC